MKRFMLISLMSCMFVGQAFCIDEPVVSADEPAVVAEGSDNADNNAVDTVVSADEPAVVAGDSDNSGFFSKPVQWSLRGAQVGAAGCLLGGVIQVIDNTRYANSTLIDCFSGVFASEDFWRTTTKITCLGLGTGFIAYLLYDWRKSCSDTSADKASS